MMCSTWAVPMWIQGMGRADSDSGCIEGENPWKTGKPQWKFGIPKMDDFFFVPEGWIFFFLGGIIFDVNYGFCSEKNTAI